MKMEQTSAPLVTVTDAARRHLERLLAAESREGLGLRLGVQGGGCSGFSYKLEFTRQEPGDSVVELDGGVRVFMDPKSLLYLKGMTLDFKDGLAGKGFVFQNPNAQNTCGCGESFSV
jgi:iron-sulfur cluster assembly protein